MGLTNKFDSLFDYAYTGLMRTFEKTVNLLDQFGQSLTPKTKEERRVAIIGCVVTLFVLALLYGYFT
jgi:hypothetical protein